MSGIHIILPKNCNVKLWRYLDFPKFTDLPQRSALWLTRLDKLQDTLYDPVLR